MLGALNSEDRVILGSLVLSFGGILFAAELASPRLIGITAFAVVGVLIAGWYVTRGSRLAWLLLFGVVAGVLELWADWIHVTYFGSLVYTDYFGFQLLASPSYMPIGWWITVVQFAYLALRLSDFWPKSAAVALVTVLGMSLAPWYEEFAASAGAWHYTTTGPTLSQTPVWIILTYGGCMFAIATMAVTYYRPRFWAGAVLGGIFTGAGIMFSAVLSFELLA